MKKCLFSILLALVMMIGVFTVTAFAAEGDVAQIGDDTYPTLQEAIDAAVDGDTIELLTGVTENVKITQKADLDLIIDGKGNTFTGVMTVFGDARHTGEETMTIKNIVFQAVAGADSCIISPDRTAQNPARYSYSHNVTVDNCLFNGNTETPLVAAAIRHGDGGDVNWTVTNCTVDANMHSMLQVNNVNGKLTVDNCKVYSKNGINLNSCTNVEITNCEFDVAGYAVRGGVSSGGNLGETKTYVLENNTLKSACDDGDAVLMLRASAVDVKIDMEENVVSGTTQISGTTAATTVNADANYWDGKSAPVVAEGSASVEVKSYYTDVDSDGKPTGAGFDENQGYVAAIGATGYTELQTALQAVQSGDIVTLLDNITITEPWDSRPTDKGGVGATFSVPVTIDGNEKKITFACNVQDGANYHAPFRFEADVELYNLTIDMSNAVNSKDSTRLRAISAAGGDLTIDNCIFIGNPNYTNTRAIIFGEGAQNSPETDIRITNCTFIDWRYGVTDNENLKDVGNVSVTGNTFTNAGAQLSASESLAFTGNKVNGGKVSITSHTGSKELEINATDNTFVDSTASITADLEADVTADPEFGILLTAGETKYYKVTFEIPKGAEVEVWDSEGKICESKGDFYALSDGTYSYTVSKFGYFDVNGCFTVEGEAKVVTVNHMTYIPNVLAVITGATAPKAADAFADVDASAWYYDAVNYVLENGLMNGMSEDSFAPNGTMTRAMVWTVLGRMAGQEFNGIGANWYTEAQNWAIIAGVSDGTNPNGAITREELVTMLWRFVGQPVGDVSMLQWYGDTASVSDWAAEAMAWAVNSNIIQGTNWNLNPGSTALRAQVAAILMRYCG